MMIQMKSATQKVDRNWSLWFLYII